MKKKIYMAPMIEVLNCKVESGFAGSNPTSSSNPPLTSDQLEGISGTTDGGSLFN